MCIRDRLLPDGFNLRGDTNMAITSCFLKLGLETRDAAQIETIRQKLTEAGFGQLLPDGFNLRGVAGLQPQLQEAAGNGHIGVAAQIETIRQKPVSYTHLDVYKRQTSTSTKICEPVSFMVFAPS